MLGGGGGGGGAAAGCCCGGFCRASGGGDDDGGGGGDSGGGEAGVALTAPPKGDEKGEASGGCSGACPSASAVSAVSRPIMARILAKTFSPKRALPAMNKRAETTRPKPTTSMLACNRVQLGCNRMTWSLQPMCNGLYLCKVRTPMR